MFPVEWKARAVQWGRRVFFIGLVWIFLAQLALGARHLSLTVDEPSHVINGYAILTTGSYWTVPAHTHPPLVNLFSAFPLLADPGHPDPRTISGWQQDYVRFVYGLMPQLRPLERLAFIGRFPIMLLAVLLLALVYRWAKDRGGASGGLLAAALMVWDPTLLAHAQVATTDLGMTLYGFAFVYLLDRLLRRPTALLWGGAGVLLGAAMATKASGLLLVPVGMGLLGWAAWEEFHRTRRLPMRWVIGTAALLGIAGLTVWAVYGFQSGGGGLIPRAHLEMLRTLSADRTWGAFAAGQQRRGGWWWYFLYTIAIKTPLPILIALVLGGALVWRAGGRRVWAARTVWGFPLFYLALAIWSGVNVGYRHLLPIFPFVYVALGGWAGWLCRPRKGWQLQGVRWGALGLGVWLMVGTLRVYPFPLAYFNELVGGPYRGYRYLVDSNVDWGHGLKALREWMVAEQVDEVLFSYYSWIDPTEYGVRYRALPPAFGAGDRLPRQYDPAPGVYVIGATPLQGLLLRDPQLYEWFRHREPVAQPGYGLLVYRVEPHDPPARWIAQCRVPVVPLTPRALKAGLGRSYLREVRFDCTQSWIYPGGGKDSGWYAFFRPTWLEERSWLTPVLGDARLSYEQPWPGRLPSFTLFEWTGHSEPVGPLERTGTCAPADWAPSRVLAERAPLQLPGATSGPLTLLGYRFFPQAEGGPEIWSYWRVEQVPKRPLSLMAHLIGGDNRPIAVGDGLGVDIDQWRPGDWIVQRHRFAIPAGTASGTYWVQLGAYWADPLERWSFIENGRVVGDRVIVGILEVH